MPRTAVPVTPLVPNSSIAQPAGTAIDATNHHVINNADPELMVLRITNTHGSVHPVTIKAGANPPAVAAGQGDLVLAAIAATTGVALAGPFESGRFLQADGSLRIDIDAGHTGTITCLRVPRNT